MPPKAGGDVLLGTVRQDAVETLVGGGTLQRTEVTDERPYLDVVEVGDGDTGGDEGTAAVPRHMKLRVLLVQILRQDIDSFWVAVAAHEGEAGDVVAEALHEIVERFGVEWKSYVLPEIMAVTARTPTGASADVDGQRHLIGYLLKYTACVDVLKHVRNISLMPLPDEPARSSRRASGSR